MNNFWDFSVWGTFNLFTVLLLSLLLANAMKRMNKWLNASLIPTSVLGGAILLIIAGIFRVITGDALFESAFFGTNGSNTLEIITYHALALGFIASTLKSSDAKLTKKRATEIFNTGVTTVSTYLMQAVAGLGITIICAIIITDFFPAAGILLPFGYGQGTGQALNYGMIYENDYGFDGGRSFGLTIAALGFLSASIGGVIHLTLLKRKGKIARIIGDNHAKLNSERIESPNEIPMQGSMDKITVQVALVAGVYIVSYLTMILLGFVLPGLKSVVFGFNFLIGVLFATLLKFILNKLRIKRIVRKKYINNFLMTRVSNFCFDVMVVAGIAAIRLDVLEKYWGIMIILGIVGLFITYFYERYVAKALFPEYQEEQFLMMYGMLTGTASTGTILLREIDPHFETPAADNMVYQNFPAIVFGFPMMLLATFAPKEPVICLGILAAFFIAMNIILFRSRIFKRKSAK